MAGDFYVLLFLYYQLRCVKFIEAIGEKCGELVRRACFKSWRPTLLVFVKF